MRQWTIRIGLSLLVVLGFWANDLPAQQQIYLPAQPQIFVIPTVPYEPAHQPYGPTPLAARPVPPPSQYPLHRSANNHGLGCGMDPWYSQCGNLHYEARFVFSSCRWFFNETCPPGGFCGSKNWLR